MSDMEVAVKVVHLAPPAEYWSDRHGDMCTP